MEAKEPLPTPVDELFFDAFRASPIGMAIETLEGQPLFANPALCSMFGFSEEEMLRKHCVEFSPPEDAEKDWAFFKELKAGFIDRYHLDKRFFRRDGSLIWGRLSISLLKSGGTPLVVAAVEDITDRKLAEDKLREYERAVEGSEEMIAVVDREYRYVIANRKFLKIRNMTKEEVVGRIAHDVLNEGVFETIVKPKLDECFQGKVVRYEMKYTYPDIGERDLLISYFPIEVANCVDRVVCTVQDITERKLAEEALATVHQKLIEAQEEERTRVARELHDDISQRLALLTVNLQGLQQNPPSSVELMREIGEASKQLEDLGSDVQTLSHRLHSSKLEYLGLAAAAGGFCRELSARNGVEIDFRAESIPKDLPKEISISLFRVLQEALQNASKHSGSRNFQVALSGGSNQIRLTVHDMGIGFNPEEAMKAHGLGLASMKERLRLVKGDLSINSQAGRGTTVEACVPLTTKSKSEAAAG